MRWGSRGLLCCLIPLFLITATAPAVAQRGANTFDRDRAFGLTMRRFTKDDGLPQSTVNDIVQTRLW